MSFGKFAAFALGGSLITEAAGYLWHRWACHAGTFRPLLNDLLRRRHFDHHVHKYAGARLRYDTYSQSCDIAFRVLGVILVTLTIVSAVASLISLGVAVALLVGILVHAVIGIKMHSFYHLSDGSIRRLFIFKFGPMWRAFLWLRDFHDVHHVVNSNYSLVLPLFDLAGGTYVSPRRLNELQAENLFPRFDSKLSSSCETPLF
jgi:sterol desaturase/sphingolipid hydroxylase (fatty acid hydroxylase superfamily)